MFSRSIELSRRSAFLGGCVPTVVLDVGNLLVPLPWEPIPMDIHLLSYLVTGVLVAAVGWGVAESWRLGAWITFGAAFGTVVGVGVFAAMLLASGAAS